MAENLRPICRDWIRELPAWRRVGVRGSGLLASDAVNYLVIPEVQRSLTATSRSEVAGGAPDSDPEETLGAFAGEVSRLLEQARQAIDDGISIAVDKKLNITPAMLGASVLRAMGNAIAKGAPLSDVELAIHVAERLENTAVSGRTLSQADFAATYADLFDEMWRHIGVRNLREFSHAEPGLGPDEQPPLFREGRENTWLGTARSLYSRYRLAADDPDVPGGADTLARGEAHRVCGRWGLLGESTFVVMRSLYSGLNFVPLDSTDLHPGVGEFSRDWQDEEGPMRQKAAVHSLGPTGKWVNGALAAYAQALLATYLRREVDGRYLKQTGRVNEAQSDSLKRAWMMCFEADRRNAPPDAHRGVQIVRNAIYKGIISGQAHRRKLQAVPSDPARKAGDPGELVLSIGADEWDSTLEYVTCIGPQRAMRLVHEGGDEVRLYQEAAQRQSMLPLDELVKLRSAPESGDRGATEGAGDAR